MKANMDKQQSAASLPQPVGALKLNPKDYNMEDEEDEEGEWDRDFVVIHGDDKTTQHELEFELEEAMADSQRYIIIQNKALGSETELAIGVGNILHKSAVLTGFLCLCTGLLNTITVALPAGLISSVCAFIYDLSWAYDGCSKYQVVRPDRYFDELPMSSALDVRHLVDNTILVRKDDRFRRHVHNTLAGVSVLYCSIKLYRWSKA